MADYEALCNGRVCIDPNAVGVGVCEEGVAISLRGIGSDWVLLNWTSAAQLLHVLESVRGCIEEEAEEDAAAYRKSRLYGALFEMEEQVEVAVVGSAEITKLLQKRFREDPHFMDKSVVEANKRWPLDPVGPWAKAFLRAEIKRLLKGG